MNSQYGLEVDLVQNKALGAFLMFRTVQSYERNEKTNSGCPLLLLFLVLPILYQKDIRTVLKSTQIDSGIRKFTNKFSSPQIKSSDVLLRVHDLAESYKELSWSSFILASKANMLSVLPVEALVVSRDKKIPRKYESPSIKPILIGADKLGAWFAKNSLYEIASNLKVRF